MITRARLAVRVILAVLVLGATAACPGPMRPLEAPRASLADAHVTAAGTEGYDLELDFDVLNPNAVALPLRAVDWELSLEDQPLARGRTDLDGAIPGHQSSPIVVHARIDARQAASFAKQIGDGATKFRIDGTLHFVTSLGAVAAPFEREGTL